MNAIAAPKSSALNRLEGFALTFLLQGFPTFASAALLLKLAHHEIAGGVVLFVVMASIFHGLLTPWLAPKFPKFFKHGYEPLFFNASLSFVEKIEKWRAQPTTSLQLVTNVLLLSLLAVGVMSMSNVYAVIPGRAKIELRCAIAHQKIQDTILVTDCGMTQETCRSSEALPASSKRPHGRETGSGPDLVFRARINPPECRI